MRIAAEAGALISFDVNHRPHMWASPHRALAQIEAIIPHVHVIRVNEDELRLLGGARQVGEAARTILAKGPELVIVTLGKSKNRR